MSHLDVEIGTLRRLASQTRSAVSRLTWRRATQARANRISTVLWLLEKVVPGRTVSRVKTNGTWLLSVQNVVDGSTLVLVLETGIGARTLTELRTPPTVRVHCVDLVDVALLERLQAAGLVRIVLTETP